MTDQKPTRSTLPTAPLSDPSAAPFDTCANPQQLRAITATEGPLRDDCAIDRTVAAFDNVVRRIEARDFAIPERPANLCRDCDMRFYCDRKNWHFCAPGDDQ